MPELNRSNDTTNLGPGQLTINQGQFRTQQDVIGDSLLQLGGRGEVSASATVNDPLNAPFKLYVDPYIGKDDIAFGSYATADDGSVEQELRRIELQRLQCGYTEAAPFATLNRAIIEAGLITSKDYLSAATLPFQRVCIVLAPGTYDLMCGAGVATGVVDDYDDSIDGDDVDANGKLRDSFLLQFNPETVGGIILPRGCSVVSLDLRKTILRPGLNTVPSPAAEAADYSNRRTMLRVTGEGYYYGITFMDEANNSSSHHLMSCFEFASEAQVDDFYTKLNNAFGSIGDANLDTPAARDTEWEIVGPQPAVGSLTAATDTTASASPYIYNCSIRSEYGLCGIFANGAGVGGFRSMVIAQYTGVSLQNDYTSWELFNGTDWVSVTNFTQYQNADPDNIRMKPDRRSFHIRAVNRAIIQEVSVFAIGQGVHHWTQSGGELTITNSNSNFGGCAALSEGYNAEAPPQDSGYAATHQRVPLNVSEKTNNIRKIFLGTVASISGSAVTLTADLTGNTDNEPNELGEYTLAPGSYLWFENPVGDDYRNTLQSPTAWDASSNQDVINLTAAPVTNGGNNPGSGTNYPALAGLRVYVRRLIDTRTQEERRYALLFDPLATARLPQRDYILRTDGDGVGDAGTIDVAVLRAGPTKLNNTSTDKVQVELKRINPDQAFRANSVYRPGDPLVTATKHYICNKQYTSGASLGANDLTDYFTENYAHMREGNQGIGYMPEDYFKNTQPTLIFDGDSDGSETSTTLGWVFTGSNNVWTGSNAAAEKIKGQFKTATDYLGLDRYLTSKGLSVAAPQSAGSRDVSITNQNNQEFRRPSIIRMYGHAFEWAGFGNYTKGLPQYQGGMLASNKFTYYGTSELGGRVYFTGFNEEGFSVSPRGIEDIQTGEVLSAEQIDAPDIPLDIPTEFDTLTINQQLNVNGILELNGTLSTDSGINWNGLLPEASTEEKGIIEIATAAEATAGTDTERAITPALLSAAITAAIGGISTIPSGTVQWFAGQTAPTGWLVCNGANNLNTYTYATLHAVISADLGR